MLIIRQEQIEVLAEAAFEQRIVAHLHEFFPGQCGVLSEGELRGLVQEGIRKARAYGFEETAHLCQFVDLMLLLGRDFDVSPRHAWAGQILKDSRIQRPTTRLNRLFRQALEVLETGSAEVGHDRNE